MMDTVDGCQVPTTAMGFHRWLLFEARFHRLVSSDLDAEIERCAARVAATLVSAARSVRPAHLNVYITAAFVFGGLELDRILV